jgi:hypothetical protein
LVATISSGWCEQGCQIGIVSNQTIPIGVNFGGSYNGRCWYIIWPFGPFYGYLVYFMALWPILWLFGPFYGYLAHFMAIWSILWLFGPFYGNLAHFMAIWSILWIFGLLMANWYILCPFSIFYGYLVYFFPFWYFGCTKRNLATLHARN